MAFMFGLCTLRHHIINISESTDYLEAIEGQKRRIREHKECIWGSILETGETLEPWSNFL